jgi:hypothetical protein
MLDLLAEIEPEPGAREMADGWRGLVDFGEAWSAADADLSRFGEPPVGEPLM